jgi:hypothetical protein
MNLMIFCEVAEELVGVSAEELVEEIEDDDEWYTLPEEIEDLLGSTHTFQVFDKYGSRSWSVRSIMDDVSVPVPAGTTAQCKEEPVREGSINIAIPSPITTQCKEEPVHEGSINMAIPTPVTAQCEEPVHEGSVDMAIPTPVTAQCKEEPVPGSSATTAEDRSESTRLQKPNKRLRGDDWVN